MKAENKIKQHLQNELDKLPKIVSQLELFGKEGLIKEHLFTVIDESPFHFSSDPGQAYKHSQRYCISDLIDMSLLYQLLDSFYNTTRIPYGVLDHNNNVLRGKGWQDICTQYHRKCPRTRERCLQSDRYIYHHLYDGNYYVGYQCLNGLMDYATPIIVEGQYLAGIFFGQCLNQAPDREFFRQQAREYGFDEAAYMKALDRIPIVSEEDIASIMEFYSKLGQIFTSMGLERLRQIESANLAIREREESYRLILEASTDGFWQWDIEADEIWVSPQMAALFGYPPEEMIINSSAGKSFIHPQDVNNTVRQLHDHLESKTPKFQSEHRVITITGEYLWVLSRGKVIACDRFGRPLQMACTCFDISERKRTEAALLVSEDKFSKAFDASPNTICISTLEDGRLLAVNDSFCRAHGYKREAIIGRTTAEIGLWRNEFPRQQITDLLEKQVSLRNEEVHFYNSSGVEMLGTISAERFEIDGIPCLMSIVTDITEQRQIEMEMLRMDRLNLVGEMAASIGHEIRNPMTSIRGFLQMFKEKYQEDQEFLNIMIGELDRANSIISEFLSLAKNKMVELKPVRLTSIIKNLQPLLQATAALQDKNIIFEIYDVPGLMLDGKEIRQLLLNLTYNGLEAMSTGGTLIIKTYVQGEHIILSVQDQGPGMEYDVLNKLGTPFFTTKENGTGLGLPICYGIASRHNARIDVETGPNGTTFLVCFPR
ncbi:MAG: PocR ligand-binding domain-containing protein [Syntrophomonas sp.]